ncbi:MAG: AAA family ATPase, partial [Erysipelotrichaceae bacterium]|nr:AAA family ATPase [Erysipelotrichaceae bacterium]
MKINKIETEAFAGIQDRELEFDDGINLIVGENETGKSTIVDLIYNMFFQTTNTKRNKDRSFLNLYFPNKDSEFSGDFINGKVVFENDKGKFTLEKEWNDDGGETKLTTPDKTKIKNAEQVEEIIDKELRYGKGVFNELIFSSQKRDLSIIRSLLDGDDDNDVLSTKDELSSIVAKA